jgi:hypothetical protein
MIIDVMIAVVTRVFSFVVTIINRQQPTTTKHDTRKETNKKNFIKLTCTYLRVNKQQTNKTTPQKWNNAIIIIIIIIIDHRSSKKKNLSLA